MFDTQKNPKGEPEKYTVFIFGIFGEGFGERIELFFRYDLSPIFTGLGYSLWLRFGQ